MGPLSSLKIFVVGADRSAVDRMRQLRRRLSGRARRIRFVNVVADNQASRNGARPDWVMAANESQRSDAIERYRLPPFRVVTVPAFETGAPDDDAIRAALQKMASIGPARAALSARGVALARRVIPRLIVQAEQYGAPRRSAREAEVLFLVSHFGVAIRFADLFAHLAKRVHHIHIAAEHAASADDTREMRTLVAAAKHERLTLGRTPVLPRRRWRTAALLIRQCLDSWRFLDTPSDDAVARTAEASMRLSGRAGAFVRSPLWRLAWPRRAATRILRAIERAIPPDRMIIRFLQRRQPDVLLISPLVEPGSSQVDYLRAAHRLGISTVFCPAECTDLDAQGLLHEIPDCVTVWNREQRLQAINLHGVPPQRTAMIGAPGYERFVGYRPASREEWLEDLGIDPARAVLLFAGASRAVGRCEIELATKWLRALRAESDERLRRAVVMLQPHMANVRAWRGERFREFEGVLVRPKAQFSPWNARRSVYEGLAHADAVIAVDSGILMSAAALCRPVLAVAEDGASGLGQDLRHFCQAYETRGWPLLARNLDEHFEQLRTVLHETGDVATRVRAATRSLIRPHGPDLSPGFLVAVRVVSEVLNNRQHPPARAAVKLPRPVAAESPEPQSLVTPR